MRHYNAEEHINVGVAEEVTIKTLAIEIAREVGVETALRFDPSKSDGTPRKLTDSERLFAMSWCPKTILAEGLRKTYAWYQQTFRPASFRRSGATARDQTGRDPASFRSTAPQIIWPTAMCISWM